jgi:hypothetical protein
MSEELPNHLEIVFVSSDTTIESFTEYFVGMPWTTVPYKERENSLSLGQHFNVDVIPTFIVLDGVTGKIKDSNGRATIMNTHGIVSHAIQHWK